MKRMFFLISLLFAIGTSAYPAPDLSVSGNGLNIAPGDRSPTREDGTYFWRVRLGSSGKTKSFLLHNSGDSALTIHSIVAKGQNFWITRRAPSIIAADSSGSFVVRCRPKRFRKNITSAVLIRTNDPDFPLYSFRIRARVR